MNLKRIAVAFILSQLLSFVSSAQLTDFSRAIIFFPEKKNVQLQKAVQVLREEIQKRTNIQLPVIEKLTTSNNQVIAIGVEGQLDKFPDKHRTILNKLPKTGKDGYKIAFTDDRSIIIVGHDERGALYGVGRLLRRLEMRTGQVLVPEDLNISSTPCLPHSWSSVGISSQNKCLRCLECRSIRRLYQGPCHFRSQQH